MKRARSADVALGRRISGVVAERWRDVHAARLALAGYAIVVAIEAVLVTALYSDERPDVIAVQVV